ncbi:RWD-domain-containing protein [Exidia glandulosa HHB12029]|uniref:RWD-domain-containing protein n=1 Tax=Exidia glandulosa HHB12029 TaxID=1314781 RepID=A0A165LCF3_EXIGL|nr:RWD-domain-containing protein [Exidia glandulosa HHB12029]
MSSELVEEIEILESIYPEELEKISDSELAVRIEPDEPPEDPDDDNLILTLTLRYPDDYPNTLPEFELEPIEGELTPEEDEKLQTGMREQGEQNIGTAMTFTIVSWLRDELGALTKSRAEQRRKEEQEKERRELEAEEARTKGTPVTPESFAAWRAKFERDMQLKRQREEEDRFKNLTPKEREELKKQETRPTGKQLFEQNRDLAASDAAVVEEGTTSVDVSQYDRSQAREDDQEEEGIAFSDSE